ncbi:MAG: DUF2807 domain-containing protein [Bacteroidota bacterium]
MIKPLSTLVFFILPFLFVTSCDWTNRTVVGTGDVESMEVAVPEFSGVTITGTCDVKIRTGASQHVELCAQSQILDVMTYEVRNGILNIGFRPDVSVNTEKEISADIVVTSFDYAGITGAGDFGISGDSQPALDIYITGTGNVEALEMEVDDCTIRVIGAGNCEVNVTGRLDIQISGVGNIFYRGTPDLSTDISGVGNVIALDN